MDQLLMIERLLKIGPVKRVEWGLNGVTSAVGLSAVEFYPPDAMQDMMKRAVASGDTAMVDVIKDVLASADRGE